MKLRRKYRSYIIMKRIFPVLIMIFIISCVSKQDKDNQIQEINSDNALTEGIDYVILPSDESLMKFLFGNCIPANLTDSDFEIINSILNDAIENYNKNTKKQFERDIVLSNYLRQYVAVINENNEKEVYINCFPRSYFSATGRWKTSLIFVLDGGNNYFQLKINITKKIYYDFFTNGYA